MELVLFIIFGVIIAVGMFANKAKEAREAEERRRRREQLGGDPPVVRRAQSAYSEQTGQSSLDKLSDFLKDAQERGKAERGPTQVGSAWTAGAAAQHPVNRPAARPSTPPPPAPVRRTARTRNVPDREVGHQVAAAKPGSSGGDLAETMRAKGVESDKVSSPVMLVHEQTTRKSSIADILSSERSDLAKAILLTEIIGYPVAMRDSPIPRMRN